MSMEFTLNDLQRRRVEEHLALVEQVLRRSIKTNETCLLYTSDAADEL